jgi:CheY-like chemotaxis protein
MTLTAPPSADVLIVDDTPANLRLLASILGNAGYQVRPARDGQMALTAAQSNPPDLILLDVMMPGMNGYEVIKQLKANPQTADIPVIFISALDETDDKVHSFALGAVDFVTKPFQSEEVLARVKTHITIHQLQKQQKEQIAELDAFAHTVAHDLKNPLSYIVSLADFITHQYIDSVPKELQPLMQKIQHASYRGVNIIDELLLLSSVRKQDVTLQPLDMELIVARTQDRLGFMLKEHQTHLELPTTWSACLGYAPWVEEVWVNYVSNGVKYGGKPPRLELGAHVLPNGMVRNWIKDNGQGLAPDRQAVLFTEFERLNEVRMEGYGLGLSIVKRIVNKLGGEVGVESVPGEGSTFYFDLQPIS